jgi:hypothetical protein
MIEEGLVKKDEDVKLYRTYTDNGGTHKTFSYERKEYLTAFPLQTEKDSC